MYVGAYFDGGPEGPLKVAIGYDARKLDDELFFFIGSPQLE